MKVLAGCLILLHFMSSRCELDLEDYINIFRKWESNGDTFKHEGELNIACGIFAKMLNIHLKKMAFSSRTSASDLLSILERSYRARESYRKEDYEGFQLDDAENNADFDTTLLYFFQFERSEGRTMSFTTFLKSLERKDAIEFLSACMAVALGAEDTDGTIDRIIGSSSLGEVEGEKHKTYLRNMLEYFTKDGSYYEDGKADISKYLKSKFLLLHIFLADFLEKEEVTGFYDGVYQRIASNEKLRCLYYVPAASEEDGANCTKREKDLIQYCRTEDYKIGYGCDKHKYSTLGEAGMLKMLRLFLYDDEEGCFSFKHLPHASKELRGFFRQYPELKEYPNEGEAWKNVLDGLRTKDKRILYEGKVKSPEGNITPGIKNICLVLDNLCGVTKVDPSLRLDDSEIYRYSEEDYLSRFLGTICCHKQRIEVKMGKLTDISKRKRKNRHWEPVDRCMSLFIDFRPSEGSRIELSFQCTKKGEKNLRVLDCSCPKEPLKLDSLVDFMIELCQFGKKLSREDMLEQGNEDYFLYFSDRHYSETIDHLLSILDFILPMKGASDEFIRIWNKVIEATKMEYNRVPLSTAFAACRSHITTGDKKQFDECMKMHLRSIVEASKERRCGNLALHITENVDACRLKSLSPDLLAYLSRNLVLLEKEAEKVKSFIKDVVMESDSKTQVLMELISSDGFTDKEILKLLFNEFDIAEAIEADGRRFYNLSCSEAFADLCIELASEEDADIDAVVRRAYDFIFSTSSRQIQSVTELLEKTHKRLTDPKILHDYILQFLSRSNIKPDVLAMLLNTMEKEGIRLPHKWYCGIEAFYRRKGGKKELEIIRKWKKRMMENGLYIKDDEVCGKTNSLMRIMRSITCATPPHDDEMPSIGAGEDDIEGIMERYSMRRGNQDVVG
jgi:hypothetical protein